jgi:hypothetical protein
MAKRTQQFGELVNVVGDRGENIFELAITDFSQFPRPLFRPAFLGDKWPAADYLVELTGVKNMTPIFFVQVKSTSAAIADNRLKVALPPKKKRRLVCVPGPTYLVGVHEPMKRAFIRAVYDQSHQGVFEIPVTHELTPVNLRVLYDEVKAFWKLQNIKPQQSAFA